MKLGRDYGLLTVADCSVVIFAVLRLSLVQAVESVAAQVGLSRIQVLISHLARAT